VKQPWVLTLLQTLLGDLRHARKSHPVLERSDDIERAASYPPPYPDGWYKIADSKQLKRGQVRQIQAFGHRWVLFRSKLDDQIGLLDAICPHQGAHLAGGTVKDGCLECPFHHWRFECDGQVAEIPYSAAKTSLHAERWPVCEYHGLILVYYSAERADPPYRLEPVLPPQMVFRGAYDFGRPVRMHLIEFAENSADFQHFAPLHGRMHMPWTKWRIPLVTVHHSPTWETDPERPYICYFRNDAMLELAGKPLPDSRARASITFLGPGGVTIFRISLPKLGDVILFHTHLPTGPLSLDVQFRWYADPTVPRLLVSYVVGSWIAQWKNDIAIWENKFYQQRPMLVPGDGPVLELRRWFKQFYPQPRLGQNDHRLREHRR
jgi:cholesterol 7-dehydrogenase